MAVTSAEVEQTTTGGLVYNVTEVLMAVTSAEVEQKYQLWSGWHEVIPC
jgi:hypothetical protein